MERFRKTVCALLVAVLVLFSASACASSFQNDYEAIEKTVQSVLMLGLLDESEEFVGNGSGFVAFNSNTLVTNYHVIDGAAEIWAISDNGKDLYPITRVLATNKEKDIAILEFFTYDDTPVLTPLKLFSGGKLRRGEPVVVIGSPQFITNEVTKGNISALYDDDGVPIIQFTAPVSPGSSGGPLFNDQGEVIGITRSTISNNQNTNQAIDIGEVMQLYQTREGAGIIRFPWDGMPIQTPTDTQRPTVKPTSRPTETLKPKPTPEPSATPRPPLAPPENVKGSAGTQGITITWDAVPDAQIYQVYRSVHSGEFAFLEQTLTTQYLDKGAVEPGIYSYKIKSSIGISLSFDASDAIEVASYYNISAALTAPRNFKAKAGGADVTLTWSLAKNAKEYMICRSSASTGPYTNLAIVTANEYTDKDVKRGSTYYYKIRSLDGCNVSEALKPIRAVMPKPTPTPKPTKTPRPTPTPYREPANPIAFESSYVERYKGDPNINLGIKNISGKKTIDGFTIVFYCKDVYEENIKYKGDGDIYSNYTYTKTIKPGKSIMAGYVQVEGFSNAKYVYVAVEKFHTTDGNTVTIPESQWEFCYYTLD
jgi:hypothetical protein